MQYCKWSFESPFSFWSGLSSAVVRVAAVLKSQVQRAQRFMIPVIAPSWTADRELETMVETGNEYIILVEIIVLNRWLQLAGILLKYSESSKSSRRQDLLGIATNECLLNLQCTKYFVPELIVINISVINKCDLCKPFYDFILIAYFFRTLCRRNPCLWWSCCY